MVLAGDTSAVTAPGQFINIRLDGHFLRRPVSVNDVKHAEPYTGEGLGTGTDEGAVTIIYKVLGQGTEEMTKMPAGTQLDVLTGLGNGFDVEYECQKPLLVGGGVGVPPLYRLTRDLIARGREVSVVLGFNTESEIFYAEEFEKLGAKVILATADGSVGVKGFVTDAIRESGVEYDYFYSCGPLPMLKALCSATTTSGEVSLEERMGCGFGICMGCSIMTANGAKHVCKDGPVFKKEEVIW
jgi:dihydroorotate dehydrogenase electron transfer subunit